LFVSARGDFAAEKKYMGAWGYTELEITSNSVVCYQTDWIMFLLDPILLRIDDSERFTALRHSYPLVKRITL
jgi:hypothetical protein